MPLPKPDLVVLTGVSKFSSSMLKRARLMSSLSAVARASPWSLWMGRPRSSASEETALIEKRELEEIDATASSRIWWRRNRTDDTKSNSFIEFSLKVNYMTDNLLNPDPFHHTAFCQ